METLRSRSRSRLRPALFFLLPILISADPSILNINPDPPAKLLATGPQSKTLPDFDTGYLGSWELFAQSSVISTMHMVVTPYNKAIMYDATQFQPTQLQLPNGNCRIDATNGNVTDCWVHAVVFDYKTGAIRPLKVLSNPWCSSGSLAPDGTVVSTGGDQDGWYSARYLSSCDTCDWEEHPKTFADPRWYATQVILPDGNFIIVGGRRAFSYEFVPARGISNPSSYYLPLLNETTDPTENNLYPFVHLLPDGNLFIFANNRSILLDPRTNIVLREFPVLSGGSRNYPSSGMSALLPLDLRHTRKGTIPAQILICGGARPTAYSLANQGVFLPALRRCARMTVTKPNPQWMPDQMPFPRVVGDMLILPNADLLIINGFRSGSSGWEFGRDPAFQPLLYHPKNRRGDRFRPLTPSTIPRMYHSASAVLPDGSILVSGSNPHSDYNYNGLFPTEFRVEKYYPPYLDPALAVHRPRIVNAPAGVGYGQSFGVEFELVGDDGVPGPAPAAGLKVTMLAPPFTTHGFSMSQRMVILKTVETGLLVGLNRTQIMATSPPNGAVAPPGYYMLFVVNRGVPSEAVWIHIQ